jgi:hypothetical protein
VNRATLAGFIEWALHAEGSSAPDTAEAVIEAVFDSYFLEMGGDEHHVLLEKTPGHLAYAPRILNRFPDARVVEVVRDGRDVCVSLQMQALTAKWPPTARRDQIAMWVRAIRRGQALRADPRLAERVHTIRYEDLKVAPEREITRLFEFAGLAADESLVTEVVERSDFRHRLAHPAVGDGHHHRRGEVGDWREHFSPDDEAMFREIAGEVFVAAGYQF